MFSSKLALVIVQIDISQLMSVDSVLAK